MRIFKTLKTCISNILILESKMKIVKFLMKNHENFVFTNFELSSFI
jgi:hypothetical protein